MTHFYYSKSISLKVAIFASKSGAAYEVKPSGKIPMLLVLVTPWVWRK